MAGAESASFELVRDLVAALPVLVGPDWLDNPAQPIGVEDVVAYFVAALDAARLAANVLESLRHGTPVEDDAALRDFDVRPAGLRDAVAAALA